MSKSQLEGESDNAHGAKIKSATQNTNPRSSESGEGSGAQATVNCELVTKLLV